MKTLKNIAVGFVVSFLGSIPLGYLNVIGFQLYQHSGLRHVFPFLLGVITIEAVVIYCTLVFADRLMRNRKLLRFIEGFSVIFMLILAVVFYWSAKHPKHQQDMIAQYIDYSPYMMGLMLSCVNFIQLPFWTGWNLYVLNGRYIEIKNGQKYSYVLGTLLGTFAGMLIFILSLAQLTSHTEFMTKYATLYIIPGIFFGLAIFQGFKFYGKYLKKH